MTDYTVRSMVIIAPVAALDSIGQMTEALGYSAGFSVALSPSGTGEATHRGLHATARRHFLWLATGALEDAPAIPEEPTPLTEEEIASIQAQEAALVRPTDPDSETYQEDLVAFHDALTAIRAPLHSYSRAVRERQNAIAEADKINADRAIYDAHMAGLMASGAVSQEMVDGLRSLLIISADPEVDGEVLYGRAHLDHVASINNLQVIEGDNLPSE